MKGYNSSFSFPTAQVSPDMTTPSSTTIDVTRNLIPDTYNNPDYAMPSTSMLFIVFVETAYSTKVTIGGSKICPGFQWTGVMTNDQYKSPFLVIPNCGSPYAFDVITDSVSHYLLKAFSDPNQGSNGAARGLWDSDLSNPSGSIADICYPNKKTISYNGANYVVRKGWAKTQTCL